MTKTCDRWVLAFDGSCRVCRNMSRAVAEACGDKLEVLPLMHPDVRQWREQALGINPVWAPTLIHARSGQVRAWVGIPLGFTLVRHLRIRSTLAVLGALGRIRHTARRKRLGALPLIAGLAVAASLIKVGPFGGDGNSGNPIAWVEANRQRLPRSYGELVELPMAYRKAIFNASAPETKGRLWAEHLRQYGATHPDLSDDQERALRRAIDVLGNESLYAQPSPPERDRILEDLRDEVTASFGGETQALIATLGPPDLAAAAEDCQCSTESDYCWMGCVGTDDCDRVDGCGAGYLYTCNGWCEGP